MNYFVIFQIIFPILIIHDADGVKIHAIGSNYSKLMGKIWLKANHLMLNYLPDTTFNDYYRLREPGGDALSGRRIIRELIAAQDKREKNKADQKESDYDKYVNFIKENQPNIESDYEVKVSPGLGISNNVASDPYNKDVTVHEIKEMNDEGSKEFENDYDKILESAREQPNEESRFSKAAKVKEIGMDALKAISRRDTIKSTSTLRSPSEEKSMMQDHANKIEEITNFLWTHYESTRYVYKEIKRIAEKCIQKDNLRHMVEVLEQRGMKHVKKEVLKCFYKSKKEGKNREVDYWNKYTPNNLVIKTQLA